MDSLTAVVEDNFSKLDSLPVCCYSNILMFTLDFLGAFFWVVVAKSNVSSCFP